MLKQLLKLHCDDDKNKKFHSSKNPINKDTLLSGSVSLLKRCFLYIFMNESNYSIYHNLFLSMVTESDLGKEQIKNW